jgi:hypothetical protein
VLALRSYKRVSTALAEEEGAYLSAVHECTKIDFEKPFSMRISAVTAHSEIKTSSSNSANLEKRSRRREKTSVSLKELVCLRWKRAGKRDFIEVIV